MQNRSIESPGGHVDTDTITTYIARAATVVVAFVAVLREMRERRRRDDMDDHPPR